MKFSHAFDKMSVEYSSGGWIWWTLEYDNAYENISEKIALEEKFEAFQTNISQSDQDLVRTYIKWSGVPGTYEENP